MQLIVHIDEEWQQDAAEEVARRFEEANPDVTVLVMVMPNAEIREALRMGTSEADVVLLYNSDIIELSRQGRLLDLQGWLEQYSDLEALFHPAIFRLMEHDGRVAALPLCATMKGVFYDKRWFDRAGVPYPEEGWTWEAFQAIAAKLQQANVQAGEQRHAARISFHREYIGLLLLSAGTDWLSPDQSASSGYANSPQAIRIVQWAADLVREHRLSRATQDWFVNGDMLAGETGMMLDYYIMLHELQPVLQHNLGIAGLPRIQGGPRMNEPWACGFGISSASAEPALAFSLLRELACTDNALTRLVTEGFIAALRSAFAGAGHERDPLRGAILAELAYSAPLPAAASNAALFRLLDETVNPALARIVFEGADVKGTLDELAAVLDEKLQAHASEAAVR